MRTTIQISDTLRKRLKILASEKDVPYERLLEDMVDVFKEVDDDKTILSIPTKLATRVKEKLPDTDFKSVSDYITHFLRVVLSEAADKPEPEGKDVDNIKEKLRSLGYLG